MERCDTCLHWTDRPGWEQSKDGLKRCAGIREKWKLEDVMVDEVREQRYDTNETEDAYDAAMTSVLAEAKACVMDGSSYMAELLTRPDFGCVLWKPKK